jgi:hypothetical protein
MHICPTDTRMQQGNDNALRTRQMPLEFRRTHSDTAGQDPEEALKDLIAADVGFLPDFLGSSADTDISFDGIRRIKEESCQHSLRSAEGATSGTRAVETETHRATHPYHVARTYRALPTGCRGGSAVTCAFHTQMPLSPGGSGATLQIIRGSSGKIRHRIHRSLKDPSWTGTD